VNGRDQLLRAARALRGDLPRLAIDDGDALDRRLADAIAAVEDQDLDAAELGRLLRSSPAAMTFTDHFLREGVPPGVTAYETRGYSSPAGRPRRISAAKWGCPHGDFDFYQRSPRERVPQCPTHELQLARASD
jgi:hypothetical protein